MDDATTFMSALSSGLVAARVASMGITGSGLGFDVAESLLLAAGFRARGDSTVLGTCVESVAVLEEASVSCFTCGCDI